MVSNRIEDLFAPSDELVRDLLNGIRDEFDLKKRLGEIAIGAISSLAYRASAYSQNETLITKENFVDWIRQSVAMPESFEERIYNELCVAIEKTGDIKRAYGVISSTPKGIIVREIPETKRKVATRKGAEMIYPHREMYSNVEGEPLNFRREHNFVD